MVTQEDSNTIKLTEQTVEEEAQLTKPENVQDKEGDSNEIEKTDDNNNIEGVDNN